eukprot:2041243-Pleurochrysis_carterae.AAC.1
MATEPSLSPTLIRRRNGKCIATTKMWFSRRTASRPTTIPKQPPPNAHVGLPTSAPLPLVKRSATTKCSQSLRHGIPAISSQIRYRRLRQSAVSPTPHRVKTRPPRQLNLSTPLTTHPAMNPRAYPPTSRRTRQPQWRLPLPLTPGQSCPSSPMSSSLPPR